MTNHGKTDHWKSLAANLGADAPSNDAPSDTPLDQNQDAPTAEPQSPERADSAAPAAREMSPATPKPKAPARRAAPGWSALAEQFGLAEPQQRAEKRTEAPSAMASEAPAARAVTPEPPAPLAVSPTPTDEPKPAESSAAEPSETPSSDEPTTAKRRKRRRRPRKSRTSLAVTAEPEDRLPEPEQVDLFDDIDESPPAESEAIEEAQAEAESSEAPPRPKRRRRRRSSRKKKTAPEGETKSDAAVDSRASEQGSQTEDALAEDEEDEDSDAEQSSDDSPSHRAIPSWQDAVGMIVSANIEARSRRPAGSSSRSRGGRDRGSRDASHSRKTKPT